MKNAKKSRENCNNKKKVSWFANICDMLFNQKTPALSVLVVNGGDMHYMGIATTRLN